MSIKSPLFLLCPSSGISGAGFWVMAENFLEELLSLMFGGILWCCLSFHLVQRTLDYTARDSYSPSVNSTRTCQRKSWLQGLSWGLTPFPSPSWLILQHGFVYIFTCRSTRDCPKKKLQFYIEPGILTYCTFVTKMTWPRSWHQREIKTKHVPNSTPPNRKKNQTNLHCFSCIN